MSIEKSLTWEAEQFSKAIRDRRGNLEEKRRKLTEEIHSLEREIEESDRAAGRAKTYATIHAGDERCPRCFVHHGKAVQLEKAEGGRMKCPDCGTEYEIKD